MSDDFNGFRVRYNTLKSISESISHMNGVLSPFRGLTTTAEGAYIRSLTVVYLLLGNDYIPNLPAVSNGRDLMLLSCLHQKACFKHGIVYDGYLNYNAFISLLEDLSEHEASFLYNKTSPDI